MKNIHIYSQGINRVILFVLFFVIITYESQAVTGPGQAWQYCRRITLSPSTPTAGYQVKITLTAGQYSNMKADGSDIRFYDANNNNCNYWIEKWNNTSTSIIWVKAPVANTTYLFMYYGNASATAVSNGNNTFDFFDDFLGSSLGANWTTTLTGGSVTVASGQVTIANTNSGTVGIYTNTAFTPTTATFFIELKHKEGAYHRNRFYASTSAGGGSPIGGDMGFFGQTAAASSTGNVFWGLTSPYWHTAVSANTDYLSRWQITNGSTYIWSNLNYNTGAVIDSRSTTVAGSIRYLNLMVTEMAGTNIIADWVRVRQHAATEPTASVSAQTNNISLSVVSQNNCSCYGLTNGAITVAATGGTGGINYVWNNSATTASLSSLAAGTYTVTATEATWGLSGSLSVVITQPSPLTTNIISTKNISCHAGADGNITIQALGGTSPYEYSVDNGLTWIGSAVNPYTYTGLIANTEYRIRVRDINGCTSLIIP